MIQTLRAGVRNRVTRWLVVGGSWVVVALTASAVPAAAASCESLASLALPQATITLAQPVAAGAFTQPGGRGGAAAASPFADLPAFCRVAATLRPSSDSDIKIEVWLPAENWNGKFNAVGNGGWAGSIDSGALAVALRRGYAAAATDTGHEGGGGPWMQRPEKLIDFGHRAVHEMTVKAKAIAAAFYGNTPRLSYFTGCSAGGRQGMKAAQRYPADFDGIVAGAPAVNTTGRAAFAIWIAQQLHKDEAGYIPPAKYPAIHDAVLAACDAADGVTDRVIENPRACTFNPAVLACKDGDGPACLTAPQVESARTMYQPLKNPRTGQVIFPGLEYGSELGWSTFGGAQPFPVATQMYQQMVFKNPAWDYRTLGFDSQMALVDIIEAGNINALDGNLKPFIARGGKLIQYHGWADQQIPSGSSTSYYDSVVKEMGGASRFADGYRLFMVPGMGHCGGGDGPASFDMLTALEQWVEQKKAPAQIPAAHVAAGAIDRTRILCPYPQQAAYKGTGSTSDAASFVCK
jgi:feruloyl esterase